MKLDKLYLKYENEIIERFFSQIIERFKSEKKAFYVDKNLNVKEDEILELGNINYPSGYINVYRRFDDPEKWDVTFLELKNAVKLTLRSGGMLGSGDYNKMSGTSNFVGTPLRALIALVPYNEYKKFRLAGQTNTNPKCGAVKVNSVEFKNDFILIEVENEVKKIKMDFWEIDEKEFKRVIDESPA